MVRTAVVWLSLFACTSLVCADGPHWYVKRATWQESLRASLEILVHIRSWRRVSFSSDLRPTVRTRCRSASDLLPLGLGVPLAGRL